MLRLNRNFPQYPQLPDRRLTLCGAVSVLLVLIPFATHAESVVGKPTVVDGDTLSIGDTIVRISGIDAPETDQHCVRDNGDRWNCGKAAGTELKQAIGDNTVTCSGNDRDRYGRLLATCRIGRTDIGAYLVTRGLAVAYVKYEDTYQKQESQAKRSRRGIWSGSFDMPQQHRQRKWALAENTKINTERGERWFCDEQQAIDAGWRPPRQG